MELIVNLVKILKSPDFRRFQTTILLVITLAVAIIVYGSIRDSFLNEYENIAEEAAYVSTLKNNTERLDFIKKHKLTDSSIAIENIVKLLATHTKKYKTLISSCKILNDASDGNLNIRTYQIDLFAWHDIYIFNLLEDINNLSPGFVYFENIDVRRISNINQHAPSLKVCLVCRIYYKY